jgi:hypothetical protein
MPCSPSITRRAFNKAVSGAAFYPLLAPLAGVAQTASAPPEPSIAIHPATVAYLMADEARRDPALKTRTESSGSPKRFWVEQWRDPQQIFAWTLQVEKSGDYELTLMISAPPGTAFEIGGPRNTLRVTTSQPLHSGYAWDRITLPASLSLPTGRSQLSIRPVTAIASAGSGAALKSIELLKASARPALDARIRAFRSDTTWLSRAKFGFMCQCGEWSYPPHGPRKPWPAMADQFDVATFADLVASTGAGYAVWSATWATYYFPAPIRAIDRILPGRTCERDLIGEIADALARKNIRLILYYHVGHESKPANGSWWSHNWVSQTDKSLFFDNWCSIIAEVGHRYGDRLAGWMFDDELVYYPAPYERLGVAAKAGNPRRILSYNPWIQARGTDFQDFQFGEGFQGASDLPISARGIWPSGPMKGLHAHGNFQVDGPDWGISKPDTVIEPPHLSLDKATQSALEAAQRDEALSWNLLMYDDGAVSPRSLDLLRQVGRAVRGKYPIANL